MAKILVVEDDLTLSAGLCFELDSSGYLSIAAYSCQKVRALLQDTVFDLAILDVNLPDGNGFDLCREIRGRLPGVPVIFLTANDLEEDVLRGYALGADDYVTKPFSVRVLLQRIEVALRRSAPASASGDRYDDGFLRLDLVALTAVKDGENLSLTPNEYKLLRLLTANAGKILTRKLLLEKLWDCDENFIDDHTLTVTMNRLRVKIEAQDRAYIRTVRGMGYVWTGVPL